MGNVGRLQVIGSTIAALAMAAYSTPGTSQEREIIEGWGNWRFGQSLDQALAESGNLQWNSYSLQECRDRMELEGCLLSTYEGPTLPPVDAIPLRPTLKFNEHGVLTQIVLGYERSGQISQTQCLNIFGRLSDWQMIQIGAFRSDDPPASEKDIRDGWIYINSRTPHGLNYRYGRSDNKKAFITSFLHWVGPTSNQARPVDVNIFASFITVDGVPHCSVTISYNKELQAGGR